MTSLTKKATGDWTPRQSREVQVRAVAIATRIHLLRIAKIAERIGGQDGHVIAALADASLHKIDTILDEGKA